MAYLSKKVIEITGGSKFAGHRFFVKDADSANGGKLFTERRCKICGKWFQYVGLHEPAHCGNSACEEFWRRHLIHQFAKTQTEHGNEKAFFGRTDVVKKILNNSKNIQVAERLMVKNNIIPDACKPKDQRKKFVFALKGAR